MPFTPQLNRLLCISLFAPLLLLTGCATPQRANWGEEADITPGWAKFKQAVVNAARDPVTWVPATAAVVVYASGRDEELTQHALKNNWLYGDKQNANALSDKHAILTDRIWLASMLLAESGESAWGSNKLKGLATEYMITGSSIVTTNVLKKAIRRREPDLSLTHVEYEAFPSNHSTPQFTQAALIRRNLRYMAVNDAMKGVILTGAYLSASSSAYGRIEGGLHHFSDQFAGVALGNFIGLALYDTFFEEQSNWLVTLSPSGERHGYTLQLSVAY